jgi:dienelactone hydrolase
MRHPIDLVGGAIVAYGPDRLRFFTDGWGDLAMIGDSAVPTGEPDPIAIEWVSETVDAGMEISVGIFESPASVLPEHARHGAVTRIVPRSGTDRMVVMMAAWNEHDSRARFGIARRLAGSGVGSLVLENPYYGVRRPDEHDGQPIRTVDDFFRMGIGAVTEGRGLLATVRSSGYMPGVAGYSMGGNLAALVSSTMPFPVATAPLAASYSPSPVYLDGVLRSGIDWAALGGEDAAAPRLRRTLLAASVLDRPAPEHARHAILVSARSDGYVPPSATEALHAHWPGSELRWLGGGHATLLWFHKGALAAAVEDSFARLIHAETRAVDRVPQVPGCG